MADLYVTMSREQALRRQALGFGIRARLEGRPQAGPSQPGAPLLRPPKPFTRAQAKAFLARRRG